jgi:hypothetical protein
MPLIIIIISSNSHQVIKTTENRVFCICSMMGLFHDTHTTTTMARLLAVVVLLASVSWLTLYETTNHNSSLTELIFVRPSSQSSVGPTVATGDVPVQRIEFPATVMREQSFWRPSFIGLPRFRSAAELRDNAEWRAYLTYVYGDCVLEDSAAFPIDTRNFTVFYSVPCLPRAVRAQLELADVGRRELESIRFGEVYDQRVFNGDEVATRRFSLQVAGSRGPRHSVVPGPWMAVFPAGAANDSWVEVVHDCCDWFASGYWMFRATGSGNWYNVGRTRAFRSHADACAFFGGSAELCQFIPGPSDVRMNDAQVAWIAHMARRAGLDSVQFVDHALWHENSEYEIVDVRAHTENAVAESMEACDIPPSVRVTFEQIVTWPFDRWMQFTKAYPCLGRHEGPKGKFLLPDSCHANTSSAVLASGCGRPCHCAGRQALRCAPDETCVGALPQPLVFEPFNFTIVATADLHGALENTSEFGAILGELRRNGPVLLVDSGDAFIGTAFFARHGPLGVGQVMRDLGYACMAVGNHELEHVDDLDKFSEFVPLLSLDLSHKSMKPSMVFPVGGAQVGVTAVGSNVSLSLAVELVRAEALRLRVLHSCDLVILLSHMGLDMDVKLRSALRDTVDAIFGAHTHTVFLNVSSRPALLHMGSSQQFYSLLRAQGSANGSWSLEASIKRLHEPKRHADGRGALALLAGDHREMDANQCRQQQPCALGSFVTDVMLHHALCGAVQLPPLPLIAIREAGSMRGSWSGDQVDKSHLHDLLPWDNQLVVLKLNASLVAKLLVRVSGNPAERLFTSGFLSWNATTKSMHIARLDRTHICANGHMQLRIRAGKSLWPRMADSHTLNPSDELLVVMTSWLASGNDGAAFLASIPSFSASALGEVDIFAQFLRGTKPSSSLVAFLQGVCAAAGSMLATFVSNDLFVRLVLTARAVRESAPSTTTRSRRAVGITVAMQWFSAFFFWYFFYLWGDTLSFWLASAIAGLINVIATTPVTNVILHLHSHDDQLPDLRDIQLLFRGLLVSILLICYPVVASNLFVLFVELDVHQGLGRVPSVLIASLASTTLATLVTYPLQHLRLQIQLRGEVGACNTFLPSMQLKLQHTLLFTTIMLVTKDVLFNAIMTTFMEHKLIAFPMER